MSQRPFTVFYAWQSDSPARVNRNFIEAAAETVLKRIEKGGVVEGSPRLDKDTKGIPGTPDIFSAILQKISNADVFLADITYVGNTLHDCEGKQELLPNPKVMLELGYALASLGPDQIVSVMNTGYGSEEELPFDLRNKRWPITYSLSPDAPEEEKKQVKERLVCSLREAIEVIAVLPSTEAAPSATQLKRRGQMAVEEEGDLVQPFVNPPT